MQFRQQYILNIIFLPSLATLLLNDFLLKESFGNLITGKLSDLSGIVLLFLVLRASALSREPAAIITILLFTAWKLPFSAPFITWWNHAMPSYQIGRIVDPGDLLCLMVLIPLLKFEPRLPSRVSTRRIILFPVLAATLFAFCATSHVKYLRVDEVVVNDKIRTRLDVKTSLERFQSRGLIVQRDSFYYVGGDTFKGYIVKNVVLPSRPVHKVSISFHEKKRRTEVYIGRLVLDSARRSFGLEPDQARQLISRSKSEVKDYFRELLRSDK
jgi:hypothetical protein